MRISVRLLLSGILSLIAVCSPAFFVTSNAQAQTHVAQTVWRQSWVEFKNWVNTPTIKITTTGRKDFIIQKMTGPTGWQVQLFQVGGGLINVDLDGNGGADTNSGWIITTPGNYYLKFTANQPGGDYIHVDYSLQDSGQASAPAPAGPKVWKQSWVEFKNFVIVKPFDIDTAGPKLVTFDETSGQWTLEVIDDIAATVAVYTPTGNLYDADVAYPAPSTVPVVRTGTTLPFTVSKPGKYALVFHAVQEGVAMHHVNYSVTDAP
jgi:hypothetical protein